MADSFNVKIGTKVEKDDLLATDIRKLAIAVKTRPESSLVEGQEDYSAWTQCPWCGSVNWTVGLDTDVYETVLCGNCGMPYRA